jgi:hypothetical protein
MGQTELRMRKDLSVDEHILIKFMLQDLECKLKCELMRDLDTLAHYPRFAEWTKEKLASVRLAMAVMDDNSRDNLYDAEGKEVA